MNTHLNNSLSPQHVAAANSAEQTPHHTTPRFVDKRPVAVAQRKLQGQLDNRTPTSKLPVAPPVVQRVVNPAANGRWESTEIANQSFATQQEAQAAETEILRRRQNLTLMPAAFGRGAPYRLLGYPHLGTIPSEHVSEAEDRANNLRTMLPTLSAENHVFNTAEQGRQPTMYFQAHGQDSNNQPMDSSGRIRQQHRDGPAAYVDEEYRDHLFSSDQALLDAEDERDVEGIDVRTLAHATEGMHHIEIERNPDPQRQQWELAHASGGGLSRVPVTQDQIDEALARNLIDRTGVVRDRR